MKRVLLLLSFVSLAAIGCQAHQHHMAHGACNSCGARRAARQADYVPQIPCHYDRVKGPAGPPTAQYAYPYYTTRGPRDFLMCQPDSIGP